MNHEFYIKRCLQIAQNGIGTTRPNPSVGAVIVCENKIIGEGFTSFFGGNHAEVNAINSVKNKNLLKEATLYVTLEPCSHYGKTPPCSDLIIKHHIKKVVIGAIDSNKLVAGKGIERLEQAGVKVITGILNKECREHHKRFFTFQEQKRPYIILKWAETQNGFIAPLEKKDKKPVWISNVYSQQLVHKWRSEEHAIFVGTNTVIEDNPKLNVRSWSGENPVRFVLDKNLRISNSYNILNNSVKTIVINQKLEEIKGNTFFEIIDFRKNIAKQICDISYKHAIQSIIIEGGLQTLQTFIDANLWDEARVFKGVNSFKSGVEAPKFSAKLVMEKKIVKDLLRIYKND